MATIFELTPATVPTLIKLNAIYKAINNWVDDTTNVGEKIASFIQSQEDIGSLVESYLYVMTREDRTAIVTTRGDPSSIIDKAMKTLEKRFENVLKDTSGGVFVTTSIDYKIRRNLFERNGVFQQKSFGFEIKYSKTKNTIYNLRKWLADESADENTTKFLIVYVMLYMLLAYYISGVDLTGRGHYTKIFTRFWRDKSLAGRVKNRTRLYDETSWVYHPLTDEEDREYLLIIGRTLLEKREIDQRRSEILNKNLKKISEMQILTAKIRILCGDIKVVIQNSDFITKNYNTSFSSKIDAYIIQNDIDLKIAYDKYVIIMKRLASWKLFNERDNVITWNIPEGILRLDKKKIFKAAEENVKYLFSLADVLSVKFVAEQD